MHVFLYRLCQYVSCLLWERKSNSLTKALVNEYFSTTMQLCTQPWKASYFKFPRKGKKIPQKPSGTDFAPCDFESFLRMKN